MEYPEELRYTEQHEWARQEEHGVRVGITDFAQDALGDVVYVDVPEAGTEVKAGQPFGEVESTKSVTDVFTLSAAQAHKAFDTASAQNKELWELAQKLATETGEPIRKHVAKVLHQAN